jgi:hypothetical protein
MQSVPGLTPMNYNVYAVGRMKPSDPGEYKTPVIQKHRYKFVHQGLTPTGVISHHHFTGNIYRRVKSVEVSWEHESVFIH